MPRLEEGKSEISWKKPEIRAIENTRMLMARDPVGAFAVIDAVVIAATGSAPSRRFPAYTRT